MSLTGTARPLPATEEDAALWAKLPRAYIAVANILGTVVVYVFLSLIVQTDTSTSDSLTMELGAVGVYLVASAVIALRLGNKGIVPVARWLRADRDPTPAELEITLRQPLRQATIVLALWIGAAAFFAGIHLTPSNPIHHDPGYGGMVGAVVVLGGLAAATLTYLLVEKALRPVFARALANSGPSRSHTLGVKQRVLVAWSLGSGLVLVALGLAPLGSGRLDLAIAFLVPVGLLVGATIMGAAARSIAHPVAELRTAVRRVERGDYSAQVPVDDASEVGLLQAGFNQMARGLAERERIREVFGTYVDQEIAEHVLREGTSTEGEEVEVTMMFVDIRGFTAFAETAAAREVVMMINRLFELTVPLVHSNGGYVDKFVGDGLLAVFGAPRRHADHADRALKTALAVAAAVRDEFGNELQIGIGLNSGTVVAGNVGGAGRFEFSVIGDAVNVAARVEAATRQTGDTILITESTKAELTETSVTFYVRPDVSLRGKQTAVALFAALQ